MASQELLRNANLRSARDIPSKTAALQLQRDRTGQLRGRLLSGKPMRCRISVELRRLLIRQIEGIAVFLRWNGHGCSFLRYAKVSEAALMCHWFVARNSVAVCAELEP